MNNIDIGSFTFIPEKKDYRIIIKDHLDSTNCYSLPAVRDDLNHISIFQGTSFLEINVMRPDPADARFLEIQKFDSVFLRLELNNSERNQVIKIDNTQIPNGLSIVYLKDFRDSTRCARPILHMENDVDRFSCESDKTQYNTREKVELKIKINAVNADISIAVKRNPHASSLRMIELLPLIFSKIPYINNWYSSSIDLRTWEDYMILNTDNLISVHHCDRGIFISNPPEYTGHIINGDVSLPKEGSEEVRNVFLTLRGDPYGFYSSNISKDKRFYFPILDPPVSKDLIFSFTPADSSSIIDITIYDPFDESTPGDSIPSLFITD